MRLRSLIGTDESLIRPRSIKPMGLGNGIHDQDPSGVRERADVGQSLPGPSDEVGAEFDDVGLVGRSGKEEIELAATDLDMINQRRRRLIINQKLGSVVRIFAGAKAAGGEEVRFGEGDQNPAEIGCGFIQPELNVRDRESGGSEGIRRINQPVNGLRGTDRRNVVVGSARAGSSPGVGGESEAIEPGGFVGCSQSAGAGVLAIGRRGFVSFRPITQDAMEAKIGKGKSIGGCAGNREHEAGAIDFRSLGKRARDIKFKKRAILGEVLGGTGIRKTQFAEIIARVVFTEHGIGDGNKVGKISERVLAATEAQESNAREASCAWAKSGNERKGHAHSRMCHDSEKRTNGSRDWPRKRWINLARGRFFAAEAGICAQVR